MKMGRLSTEQRQASAFRNVLSQHVLAAALGMSLALFGVVPQASAVVVGANWVGGFGPLWTTAANWGFADPDQWPQNGRPAPPPGQDDFEYNVTIQAGSVTLDQGTTVLNVTLGTGGTLTLSRDSQTGTTGSLTLDGDGLNSPAGSGGLLANNGTIFLDNSGGDSNNRTLRARDGDFRIVGSGTIDMAASSNNRIIGGGGAGILIHSGGHTIRGAGVVGNNSLGLQNSGTIKATHSGEELVLNANGDLSQNFNNGVLGARTGGTLKIDGTQIDNSGGLIRAQNGSTVLLRSQSSTSDSQSTHIVGGTLRSEGTGVISTNFNSAILEDVSVDAGSRVIVADGTSLNVRGTIANDGRFEIADNGGSTTLTIGSQPTTFTGTGEILMQSNAGTTARIRGQTTGSDAPADATLVNDASHLIRGAGDLGLNTLFLDNRGTISADQAGETLTVNTKGIGPGNFNAGTLQAIGGGNLEILGSVIDNTAGQIRAQAGSKVDLNRRSSSQESSETRIIGGTLSGIGDGVFRTTSNAALQGVTLAAGTAFDVENNSQVFLSGTTTNDGTITTRASGSLTQVQIEGDTVLQGAGSIVMETDRSRFRSAGGHNGALLTNGTGHTIRGEGTLGFSTISILNQGSIIADGIEVLTIDPINGGQFVNEGQLIGQGAGGMTIVQSGAAFETSGTVDIEAGSIVNVTGIYRQTGGTTTLNGANTELQATTVQLEGGTIGGTGVIDANIVNSGGTLG